MITTRITEKNVDGVLQKLKTTDERVRGALAVGLARGLLIAVGVAQVSYLSGPRPQRLDVVTTRLRGSISSEVVVNDKTITGRIGTNVPYGARWEFGFHGIEHVSAHTRVTHGVNGIGRITRGGKAAARKQKSGFAGVTFVKAHDRKIDSDGKPFLRPALADTDIGGEINKELQKVANG